MSLNAHMILVQAKYAYSLPVFHFKCATNFGRQHIFYTFDINFSLKCLQKESNRRDKKCLWKNVSSFLICILLSISVCYIYIRSKNYFYKFSTCPQIPHESTFIKIRSKIKQYIKDNALIILPPSSPVQ